jgi:hypothetical protein
MIKLIGALYDLWNAPKKKGITMHRTSWRLWLSLCDSYTRLSQNPPISYVTENVTTCRATHSESLTVIFIGLLQNAISRRISVGVVTTLRAGRLQAIVLQITTWARHHPFSKTSRPALGPTQPLCNKYRGLSVRKVAGGWPITPYRAEFKNDWRYNSSPTCAFMACAETKVGN